MNASLLDALLADDLPPSPAKAANSANRQQWRGAASDWTPCEDLRISANGDLATGSAAPDSQTFAAVRRQENPPEHKEQRGFSQDSQDSQGHTSQWAAFDDLDLSSVAWTDADIARFLDLRARLLRWGWAEAEAEALADRLVRRDREADPRVMCGECQHYRPGRCGNHQQAGLQAPHVGRDLAALLQWCAGSKTCEGAR